MKHYTTITWSEIPGLFPSGYSDKIKIYHRPVKMGVHRPWQIITENPEASTYDELNVQRQIQSANYDKYYLEFTANEDLNVEMMPLADSILIYTEAENKTLHAKIIDLSGTPLQNKPLKKYYLEFFDTNVDNYANGMAILSPLRSDVITSWVGLTDLAKVIMTANSVTYTYYSAFTVKRIAPELENKKEMEIGGVKKVSRVTIRIARQLILYMTNVTAAEFANVAAQTSYLSVTEPGYSYSIPDFEMPEVTIEEVAGGIDLNKVTLKFYDSINDINPLS